MAKPATYIGTEWGVDPAKEQDDTQLKAIIEKWQHLPVECSKRIKEHLKESE